MAGYWANSFFPFRAVIKMQGLGISPGYYEQARIHTGFHRFMEIGQIFHNRYIFLIKKKKSKLQSFVQGKGTGFYPV